MDFSLKRKYPNEEQMLKKLVGTNQDLVSKVKCMVNP